MSGAGRPITGRGRSAPARASQRARLKTPRLIVVPRPFLQLHLKPRKRNRALRRQRPPEKPRPPQPRVTRMPSSTNSSPRPGR